MSFSPDSRSYWGSYFKYRKRCLCALQSLGAPLPLKGAWVLLPNAYGGALWSLHTGAAVMVLPTNYLVLSGV